MRREYPNGLVRALRWAAKSSSDSDELLDAADEIERLKALVKSAYKEGWLSGSLAGRSWETSSGTDWVRSEAMKTLAEKEPKA